MSLSIKTGYRLFKSTSRSAVLVVMSLLVAGFLLLQSSADSAATLKPTCSDSLQQKVDAAAAGSTVAVRTDCIYRERVNVTKTLTINGQGGAEIRGSDIWTGWSQVGATWVSSDAVPAFTAHGECSSFLGDRCIWPEQVFMNGSRIDQAAMGATPAPGQFALDGSRHIVLGDNPSGATVEVTTRTRWMSVTASNVTVKGFTMKHAANDSQDGALRVNGTSNVTVRNNNLSYSHGALVAIFNSNFALLSENDLYNGGQQGFSVSTSSDVTIEKNLIHHNNIEGFQWDWEAGAMKISQSSRVAFNDNDSYSNNGAGYWCDINCSDVTVGNNRIHHNMSVGIFFEISDGANIHDNLVWENGWGRGSPYWITEAGILISSASNAEVHNNVVAWNADGIGVVSQCRNRLPGPEPRLCDTTKPWNLVHGNYIHDNVIIAGNDPRSAFSKFALAWLRDIRDENDLPFNYMFTPEANNRGANNQYWVETAAGITYAWGNTTYTRTQLPGFNATPGEEGGILLNQDISDNTGRDAILLTHSLPVSPDNHAVTWPRYSPLGAEYVSPMPVSDPEQTVTPGPSPEQAPPVAPQVARPRPVIAWQQPEAQSIQIEGDLDQGTNQSSRLSPQNPIITTPTNDISTPRADSEPGPERMPIRAYVGVGAIAMVLGVGWFICRRRQ